MKAYVDLGVVAYQSGDGTGTYKDGGGVSRTAGTLSAAAFVDGATFQAGNLDSLASALHIARNGVTNVHVQLMQRRDDVRNAGIFSWAPVITTRSDTGVAAYAQTFAATDAADIFLTCALLGSGSFKWQIKVDGAPAAGDLVVIGVGGV